MAGKEEKTGWFKRLSDRYRVNIINPENFEEISSFNASWLQVLMVFSLVFMVSFFLAVALFIYTPFRNYLAEESNNRPDEYTIQLSMMADSLENQLRIRNQYIENQIRILRGEDDVYAKETALDGDGPKNVDENNLLNLSPEDSALRKEMERSTYDLNKPNQNAGSQLHFYQPVNGVLLSGYNAATKHYAVDIVAAKDAPVKSTLDGTVVFAEYSSSTGNVLMVQHSNNFISVYKHNSVILKSVGSFVRAGETIAIIGNSGEITSGPHLHFELWQNGKPLNPEDFIVF